MYLRHTTVRTRGKTHTYWRLVRSVRRGKKVRQETVAMLGELDAEGRAKARALAGSLGARRRGPSLFEPQGLPSVPVPVHIDKVRVERPRAFGAVWLGLQLWQMLRFDTFLAERIPRGREDVAWPAMAAILVLARLCEPSSELHIAEDWYRGTALDDLLGVPEENLEFLRGEKRRYLVGTPRSELRRFAKELAEERDWKDVRDGLTVKLVASPDGKETFVLCRSEDRREKEKAMHGRFATRIDLALASLSRRIAAARRPLDRGPIERQIGKVLQRNSRAAGRYEVRVIERPAHPSGIGVEVKVKDEWNDWARLSEGAYVLRTNIADWTPEDLWRTYIQLTDAEAAFRIHKSDLSIRPIWHQTAERVQAHILVCFLAYVLWKTLEQWQSRAGLGSSPRTVLGELARIQSQDVVLPLADGRDLRLRCVVRPDRAQSLLLQRLGVELPARLRPREARGM